MSFPISLPAVIAAPSALLAKLVPPGECPEHWYCHHPEVLSQAFTTAKACGASLLLAPTAGGNAAALSKVPGCLASQWFSADNISNFLYIPCLGM